MDVIGLVASCAAALSLWFGASWRFGGAARGYRWLAATAVLWFAGLAAGQVLSGTLGGVGAAPSLADLAPLVALVPAVVGITVLATGTGPPAGADAATGPSGEPRVDPPAAGSADTAGVPAEDVPAAGRFAADQGGRAASGPRMEARDGYALPALADGYVMAVALLVIGWVILFGTDYQHSGESPGAFLVGLIHPLADVAALGVLLRTATLAWRRVALPYLSLLSMGVADALGVGWRLTGGHQGIIEQAAQVLAFCLLGLAPWVANRAAVPETARGRWCRPAQPAVDRPRAGPPLAAIPGMPDGAVSSVGTGAGLATIVAAVVIAAATMAVLARELIGISGAGRGLAVMRGPVGAAVAVAVAAALLILVMRLIALVRENGMAVRVWRESSSSLRELADRTSDIVLFCDLAGGIRHASGAVAGYGYAPAALREARLDDLIHPEDRAAAAHAMRAAIGQPADATRAEEVSGRFPCRLRAADGTWRHVECTVVCYRLPGERDQLLITVRDVSDEVALRARVTHLTFHDGLTGLPNRAYVEERARAAFRRRDSGAPGGAAGAAAESRAGDARLGEERQAAAGPGVGGGAAAGPGDGERAAGETGHAGVVFLDLDGFTAVNDSVGHGAGDLVLAQAARRLRAAVPAHDTVARWGGDEFAALIERAGNAQEIADIAERMAGSVAAEPFRVAGRDIALTASVGVAIADGSPPGLVLRNADVAMSRAKQSGGGRVEVFAAHMHANVVRRLELASELRQAVSRRELAVQYQPVVELATSRVTGVEALVRWWRDGVLAAPAEFLDVAEDSGLIASLGEWVLRTACAQAAAWRRSSWHVDVSVNLSLRQATAPRFAESVAAALADSGLPPDALTLEVAERLLVEDGDGVTGHLADLRRLGVRLAVDDFGTGYAPLASLRELPVDIIKIDPSFVAGLGRDTTLTLLTRTIVQVGRDLGIQVIAEGIEHPGQLSLLRDMGCEYGQGFLVARPMAAPGVEAFLRTAGGADPANNGMAISPSEISAQPS